MLRKKLSILPISIVLYGVAGNTTNAWTVGNTYDSNSGVANTLIEQWNGSSWNVVASPNPSSSENYLSTVAHVGKKGGHFWAVGNYYNSNSSSYNTLILYC